MILSLLLVGFILMIAFSVVSLAFGMAAGVCSFLITLPFKVLHVLFQLIWTFRWGILIMIVCGFLWMHI